MQSTTRKGNRLPKVDDLWGLELGFKRDFGRSAARFEAWWERQIIDRPPVTLHVKPTRPYEGPTSAHATLTDRWFDATFHVERAISDLARREFVGDALPIVKTNIGPELTSALLGCELAFSENTSWSQPIIDDPAQWDEFAAKKADFDCRYWKVIERQTDLALQACDGRYLVGLTDLHGNYDILAGLREPQSLCLDLIDCPEKADAAARSASAALIESFRRNCALIDDHPSSTQIGHTTWLPMFHAGPVYVPSCDFWCMLSDEHAEQFIVPRLIEEMALLERSIFHLDGPDALRHLDLVLELPGLDAVQWVYGAGAGPAAKWISVYQRIRDAGKAMQVLAESAEDALAVLDAVGSAGVWLMIGRPFANENEAEAFLVEVGRRS
jgi:hypothetical protein